MALDSELREDTARESLRDRFALAVLPVLVEQRRPDSFDPAKDYWQQIAFSAYACAHAMMKERSRRLRVKGGA